MKDFEITQMGICSMQVCTCLSPKEATERANIESPTGISSRWKPSRKKSLAPVACEANPKTHKHIILEC
jgi:hypothetical protein